MILSKEQQLRIARVELAQRIYLKQLQTNPLRWLTERLREPIEAVKWSAMPEYGGHQWDGTKDPLLTAWQALAEKKWVGVEAATGTSKTYTAARIVLWFLDVFKDSLVVTVTPKESQLKLHLWAEISKIYPKFKKVRPNADLLSLRLKADGKKSTEEDENAFADSWHAIGFVAGVGASEEAATKAQGFHRENMLIVLEECPGIHQAVYKAFENTSTGSNNLILALGNPDNQNDTLHKHCKSPGVVSVRLSALDHPNIVLGKEVFPGAVTLQSIERRREKYGESNPFFKSRVRGISPEQGIDSLIRLEWIKEALNVEYQDGMPALGVDVANSQDGTGDPAAVAYGFGNELRNLWEFACPNASHLAYNLLYDDAMLSSYGYYDYHLPTLDELLLEPSYVGVDGVGVGTSTVQAFHNENMRVISLQGGQLKEVIATDDKGKLLFEFASLRAQMYWELREDLRQGKIRISVEGRVYDRLEEELIVPKFTVRAGKITIEAKEDIVKKLGRSPNLADAMAYWNWMRKGHYTGVGYLSFMS
jgi:hypothetical protein